VIASVCQSNLEAIDLFVRRRFVSPLAPPTNLISF
jgi:hypothetical protein